MLKCREAIGTIVSSLSKKCSHESNKLLRVVVSERVKQIVDSRKRRRVFDDNRLRLNESKRLLNRLRILFRIGNQHEFTKTTLRSNNLLLRAVLDNEVRMLVRVARLMLIVDEALFVLIVVSGKIAGLRVFGIIVDDIRAKLRMKETLFKNLALHF